jgi:hypothetical protein
LHDRLPQEVSVKAAEIELIYRAQSGDTEAFGQLVTKYRIRIFNTINVIVGDETMLGISPKKRS